MEATSDEGDDKRYVHQLTPEMEDFCPKLEDKENLFTKILHSIGLKKLVCPIKAVSNYNCDLFICTCPGNPFIYLLPGRIPY